MGLAERIPGMKPGKRIRNIALGVIYISLVMGVLGAVLGGGGGDDGSSPAATDSPTVMETEGQSGPAKTTPTDTPLPTESPTPEPTPAPDEQSYSFSGSGQTATDRFAIDGGLVTVDLTHTGTSNFIVYLVNAETGQEELLVNVIGDFDGTVATEAPEGEYVLDIRADGNWEIGVEQPRYSSVEVSDLPADADRTDYAVLGPFEFEGVTRITVDAEADSNVIVWLMNHRGQEVELLFNEIGPFEGSTTTSQAGIGLIFAKIEEGWTITLERV